jgi:molybdopterin synthase sulfur carrier subunit
LLLFREISLIKQTRGVDVKIRVKFLATLFDLTGMLKTEVEVPDGVTVRKLIDILDERFPRLKSELLQDGDQLRPMYNVLVNGRAVEWLRGLDTELKDGDEVVFIPPAAGGYFEQGSHTAYSPHP